MQSPGKQRPSPSRKAASGACGVLGGEEAEEQYEDYFDEDFEEEEEEEEEEDATDLYCEGETGASPSECDTPPLADCSEDKALSSERRVAPESISRISASALPLQVGT